MAGANEFQRDGACVIRGLLDDAEVARLREGVERNLAEPSERAIEGGEPGSGRFFEDFRNWTRVPEYEEVIRGSRLGEVAAQLMGSRTARLHHDHLLVKEPGTTIRTPWHQDQPFYNVDGFDTVSFWIPLDPVPRESTLEFVAGSHATRTWYMPRSFFDDRALVFEDGTFAEVPDVEADRAAHTILGWALEPGDAVAFNMLTLHAAAGTRRPPARLLGAHRGRRRALRRPSARDESGLPRAGGGAVTGRRARAPALPAPLPARGVALVFVLLLTYVKPLSEVDALMREHVAWLDEQYEAGRFLVSGRQIPRTGGVILARGDDREDIEALAATDPFVSGGVATCEVIQFRASQTAAGLDRLR